MSQKQCLITGGGSEFGKLLTNNLIDAGYFVHLVTSSDTDWIDNSQVNTISVDWETLNIQNLKSLIPNVSTLDLVFFNHNTSALSNNKFNKNQIQKLQSWQQSYFISCQLPFYLIQALSKKLTEESKIGWMFSKLVVNPANNHGYADYVGNKFTNMCVMKSFSANFPSCFFGIQLEGGNKLNNGGDIIAAQNIINFIQNTTVEELSGNVFTNNGVNVPISKLIVD